MILHQEKGVLFIKIQVREILESFMELSSVKKIHKPEVNQFSSLRSRFSFRLWKKSARAIRLQLLCGFASTNKINTKPNNNIQTLSVKLLHS